MVKLNRMAFPVVNALNTRKKKKNDGNRKKYLVHPLHGAGAYDNKGPYLFGAKKKKKTITDKSKQRDEKMRDTCDCVKKDKARVTRW